METVKALVVPPADKDQAELHQIDPAHASFVALVQDVNTDTIFFSDSDGQAGMVKVAANGKAQGQTSNPRATQLVEHVVPGFAVRDQIVGTAVFVGLDSEGDPADVTDDVINVADGLFGVGPA